MGVAFANAPAAHADVLAVPHAKTRHHHHERMAGNRDLPGRGMSMGEVEHRYGAPLDKLAPAGGDAPRHPTINRWRYAGYTVYFERNRVIHSVLDDNAHTPHS
jgi:hypothetical protein